MIAPFCVPKSSLTTIDGQTVAVIQVVPGPNGRGVFLGQPLIDCTSGKEMPVGAALLTVDPAGNILGCPVTYRPLGGWQWGRVSGNAFVINGTFAFYLAS